MANTYERCMLLQAQLDKTHDYAERDELLQASLIGINAAWDPDHKRLARGLRALFVPDDLTLESSLYPVLEFGEVIVKGAIPHITAVIIADRAVVTAPFYSPTVLGPEVQVEPEIHELEAEFGQYTLPMHARIDRPLHLPVENIYSIYPAA